MTEKMDDWHKQKLLKREKERRSGQTQLIDWEAAKIALLQKTHKTGLPMATIDYETDYYGWTQMQAVMIQDGRFGELDYENLVEEIQSLGRREKRELEYRIETLMALLLKWTYQPNRQCHGWKMHIAEHRCKAVSLLEDSPSLKAEVPELMIKCYEFALLQAQRITGLLKSDFTDTCPWTFEQLIDDDFLPMLPMSFSK
jgi:hypothetical protein